MSVFIASLSLLLAFVASGNSLECYNCASRNTPDCTGELITCPEGTTSCMNAIVRYKYAGEDTGYHSFKSCSEKGDTNIAYKEKLAGIDYELMKVCCHGDGCNKDDIQFPPKDDNENGLKCLSCYVEGESCVPNEPVNCTGDMTHCIYIQAMARLAGGPFLMAYAACVNIENVNDFPKFPDQTMENITALNVTRATKL
ncbi:uncharacterized protein [Ambystoma mexicanum]|uniref:uncharacterized protein isoform X2 n=1 Tax=Ambystoma mexicanum TaxID=8296 RepID=UPI0037E79FE5